MYLLGLSHDPKAIGHLVSRDGVKVERLYREVPSCGQSCMFMVSNTHVYMCSDCPYRMADA